MAEESVRGRIAEARMYLTATVERLAGCSGCRDLADPLHAAKIALADAIEAVARAQAMLDREAVRDLRESEW